MKAKQKKVNISSISQKVIDIKEAQFNLISKRLRLVIDAKHKNIFLKRSYCSTDDLRRALLRYKVFGDLGYGALKNGGK